MAVTQQETSIPDLSEAQIEHLLWHTMDRIGSWPYDADVTLTFDCLKEDYENWQANEEFESRSGVRLHEIPHRFPHLRMPDSFGYRESLRPGGELQIHFVPSRIELTKDGETPDVVVEEAINAQKDQKFIAMELGLNGALEFITLVEAGLLPKPDNIVGITNETMARFSERVGLKTVLGLVEQMTKDGSHGIDENSDIEGGFKSIADAIQNEENGELDQDELIVTIDLMVKTAAFARAIGEKEVSKGIGVIANNLIMDAPLENTEIFLVWGTYEEFRDGVLSANKKFGEKILKLAAREFEAIEKYLP